MQKGIRFYCEIIIELIKKTVQISNVSSVDKLTGYRILY